MPQYRTRDALDNEKNIYRNMYKETTRKFTATRQLLKRWKGSCFKLIWHDFAVFVCLYTILSAVYRNILFDKPEYRQLFEIICIYADRFSNMIPITFLTGFYVSQVVNRWWDQFMSLPWPDRLALKLVSFCPGTVRKFLSNFFLLMGFCLCFRSAQFFVRASVSPRPQVSWK